MFKKLELNKNEEENCQSERTNSYILRSKESRMILSSDELYPNSWVGDQQAEGRHKETFLKLINLSTFDVTYEKNMVRNLWTSLSLVWLFAVFFDDSYSCVQC